MFKNKQFAAWVASFLAAVFVGVGIVRVLDLSPMWAFMGGLAATIPLEYVRDWLIDWREVERQVTSRE